MIYQWVYSYSCWNRQKRPGDARTRGFGTFSWTEGLTVEEIDELERRCSGYNYPTDYNIPPRPTKDEIEKFLPVAFYSFKLASGKQAIVRTRYVGEGFYDKRWGAIISHGLVLEEDEDWQVYPMELFDSPVFWNELPMSVREEAIGYKDKPDSPQPPHLSALKFDDLQLQRKYTPEGIASRIGESGLFAKRLSVLLNAFLTTRTDIEPLCISAPNDEIPWLFAGLTMAFPLEMSSNISFSTYISDKMPTDNEVGRWYNVVAVEKRNCTLDLEIDNNTDENKWYIDALFGSRKNLMEFLQDFTGIEIENLPGVVTLFRFLKENHALSDEELCNAQKLVLEHGNADVRKEYLEVLASGKGIPSKVSDSFFAELFSLVSDYEELRPVYYDFFLKQKHYYRGGDVLEFFSKLAEQFPREITVLWLEDYAKNDLSTTGMMFTFLALCKNGSAKNLDTSAWAFLFEEQSKNNVDWNLIFTRAFEKCAECFVTILSRCPDKTVQENAYERISQDTDQTMDIASMAIASGHKEIAKEVLNKHLLKENKKPLETLQSVIAIFEKSDKDFVKENFWDFFSCVNSKIKVIDKNSLIWLLDHKKNITESNIKNYLKDIDENIKFPEGRDSAYLEILKNFFDDNSAQDYQNRRVGIIVWFLKILDSGERSFEILDFLKKLNDFDNAYRGLSPEEQLVLLKNLLPIGVNKTDSKLESLAVEQHKKILLFFANTSSQRVREKLAEKYVELVGVKAKKKNISASDIHFLAGMRCALGELEESNSRKLILVEFANQVFRKYSNEELNSAKHKIGIETGVAKKNWDELCNEVKKANTFLLSLRRFLSSFLGGDNYGC